MVGCSMSHRQVRRSIAETGSHAAAIVEDDCVPAANFAHAVGEIASAISGRTAVLLYAESVGGISLRRQPVKVLAQASLYQPTAPEALYSALAYVVTGAAARSLCEVDSPPYEPDRWGNYLADGLLDQVLVAHPFAAGNGLFSSTIGHSSTSLPRSLRFVLDAVPVTRRYMRQRRRDYIDRANATNFV